MSFLRFTGEDLGTPGARRGEGWPGGKPDGEMLPDSRRRTRKVQIHLGLYLASEFRATRLTAI